MYESFHLYTIQLSHFYPIWDFFIWFLIHTWLFRHFTQINSAPMLNLLCSIVIIRNLINICCCYNFPIKQVKVITTFAPWGLQISLYILCVVIVFHEHKLCLKSFVTPCILAESLWFLVLQQCHHHFLLSSIWFLYYLFFSHSFFIVLMLVHLHQGTTLVPKSVL